MIYLLDIALAYILVYIRSGEGAFLFCSESPVKVMASIATVDPPAGEIRPIVGAMLAIALESN